MVRMKKRWGGRGERERKREGETERSQSQARGVRDSKEQRLERHRGMRDEERDSEREGS